MKRVTLAAVMAALTCMNVSAEIPQTSLKHFNDAIASGDEARIVEASTVLAAAAIANPDDPQSVTAAFEAASQLCVRADCTGTRTIIAFLGQQPEAAPVSVNQRNLLSAYAGWTAKPDKTSHTALLSALKGAGGDAPTLLSLTAYTRVLNALTAGSFSTSLLETAQNGASHLKPARDAMPVEWARFQLLAHTLDFRKSRKVRALTGLHELDMWLRDVQSNLEDTPEPLKQVSYEAGAWSNAISAYFQSVGGAEREIAAIDVESRRQYEATKAKKESADQPDGDLPTCKGTLSAAPRPNYPSDLELRGYVGAVLVGFDVADGMLVNMRVVAAVPDQQFEAAALKAMKGLHWAFEAEQSITECRRSFESVVIPFNFVLR